MRQPRSGHTAQRQSCPAAHVRRNWGASWSGFTQEEGNHLCSLPKRLPSVSASQLLCPAQHITAEQPVLEVKWGTRLPRCNGTRHTSSSIREWARPSEEAALQPLETSLLGVVFMMCLGLGCSTARDGPHRNASSSSGLRDAPHCLSFSPPEGPFQAGRVEAYGELASARARH